MPVIHSVYRAVLAVTPQSGKVTTALGESNVSLLLDLILMSPRPEAKVRV